MPHLSSNIPSTVFNRSLFSELLRTARCKMEIETLTKKLKKTFHQLGNPTVFQSLKIK